MDKTGKALGEMDIKIGDRTYPMKIKIGDVRKYLKTITELKKKGTEEELIDFQFDYLIKLIKQADATFNDELYLELHITDVLNNLPIALGLVTKEELETVDSAKKA